MFIIKRWVCPRYESMMPVRNNDDPSTRLKTQFNRQCFVPKRIHSVPHDDVIKWKSFPRHWLALCAGNSPVTGEFPAQRPVTRSFDVFFDLRVDQQWSNQWGRQWFETPSRSLWRHCSDLSDDLQPGGLPQRSEIEVWLVKLDVSEA